MDFSIVTKDILANLLIAENKILKMNLSPKDKRLYILRLFKEVGSSFYLKMFNDNSFIFDSTAIATLGNPTIEIDARVAAVDVVRQYALERNTDVATQSFLNTQIAKAQQEAFNNAVSLEKHPTVTRKLTGRDNCDFCRSLAGTHYYTEGSDYLFRRCCTNCDCIIKVAGFNSRNGIVNNYMKKKGTK